jgi:hypothetical protein
VSRLAALETRSREERRETVARCVGEQGRYDNVSSLEQPGAEPGVAPAYTPERVPGHCSARSSPEQLRISLRICKTAKPLIRKTRYLLHPKSVFRKLGVFEKLRKSTTTLCRETPRKFKRKNTKCGEV